MDIIVVEGIHDVSKIKSVYPNCNCIITNGREISQDTIDCIKELSKTNQIIVFTDPDSPGERIRDIISKEVINCKHAFLRKRDCISKNRKKVGIEHADTEAIKEALANVYSNQIIKETITNIDLYKLGLNGNKNSSMLRDKISDELNIGRPNCKTFLKRLNLLQITYEELENLVCSLK